MENIFLIVGLGNPGAEYARTRHNAGFMVVQQLAAGWNCAWSESKKLRAQMARADRPSGRVWLCQPQTYMNSSGEAVAAVMAYYRVPLDRLLVVVDDADLPLGHLRMRPGGSAGGHHGLESIEQHVGSRDFARLRVGIGRQDGAREITGHVLGRFASTEQGLLDKILTAASRQAETWQEAGVQRAMNQFNGDLSKQISPSERKEQ
jgi:PTH1 family peptidyl-tRNA hydrolase